VITERAGAAAASNLAKARRTRAADKMSRAATSLRVTPAESMCRIGFMLHTA